MPVEARSRRLFGDENGQTTTVMALMMGTFLFGFLALGVDTERMFHAKRGVQAAADAAAVAAAEEYAYGAPAEQTAAQAMAALNGFNPAAASNPAAVTVSAPTSGSYLGNAGYIQATVTQPIPTIFMNIWNRKATVTVTGRAVAAVAGGSPTCICLLGTTGMDLNMSNNARLSSTGCGTTVDSSSSNAVQVIGSAAFSGTQLGIVSSTWSQSSAVNNGGSIASGTKVVNPIATGCSPPLPARPTYNSAQCGADPLSHYGNGGSSYSVGPNSNSSYTTTQNGDLACYNSLTIGSNGDTVNINPGIYVINNGELHFLSATATGGSGVFFYLVGANASLVIDNGANVTLSPMTSGTYSGVLVYQDPGSTTPTVIPADNSAMSIQGGANTNITGGIYAPSSNVTMGNGSNTSIAADILANTLTLTGGTTLSSTPTVNFGTFGTAVAKLTE